MQYYFNQPSVADWTTVAPPWIALIINMIVAGFVLLTFKLQRDTLSDQQKVTKLQFDDYYRSLIPVFQLPDSYFPDTYFPFPPFSARLMLTKNELTNFTFQPFNTQKYTDLSFNISCQDILPVGKAIILTFNQINPMIRDNTDFLLCDIAFEDIHGNCYNQKIMFNNEVGLKLKPAKRNEETIIK